MAKAPDQKNEIIKLLTEKSAMKQDVYKNTTAVFDMMRDVCNDVANELKTEVEKVDKRVSLGFFDINQHAMQLKVAGDMLEFFMHTNVFEFEKTHPMFKTGYVKQNEYNSYCGMINVYNFLSDSFKFNRLSDVGYLIARIFINREAV